LRGRSSGGSALGAGLVDLGVPKNSVLDCENAIRAGKYLLAAHGAEAEPPHQQITAR